jgi:hypothetical protein
MTSVYAIYNVFGENDVDLCQMCGDTKCNDYSNAKWIGNCNMELCGYCSTKHDKKCKHWYKSK